MSETRAQSISTRPRIVVGSGWWCDEAVDRAYASGDRTIRSRDFHHEWLQAVERWIDPERILIVDSASPVRPDIDREDTRRQFVSLNENGGHARDLCGKYCGWSRSVLLSMEYAALCDCDYFVYVEQDVLVKGRVVERALAAGEGRDFLFGREHGYPNPLQQSLFVVRRAAIERFVSRYRAIAYDDYEIVPEIKFALCTSPCYPLLPKWLFRRAGPHRGAWLRRPQSTLARWLGRYGWLPFGYGRARPIDFERDTFYFQHGTRQELDRFRATS